MSHSKSWAAPIATGILGLALLIATFVTWPSENTAARDVDFIRNAPVVSIAAVLSHPEAYSVVAVNGMAESDHALKARLSGKSCIDCNVEVKEFYPDGNGGYMTFTVEQDRDRSPFRIRDSTGAIAVQPTTISTLDSTLLETSLDVFEPQGEELSWADRLTLSKIVYGKSFEPKGESAKKLKQIPATAAISSQTVNPADIHGFAIRLAGREYIESILPPDRAVFAIGQVEQVDGKVQLIADPVAQTPLLISTKPRSETLQWYQVNANRPVISAFDTGFGALVFLILTIFLLTYESNQGSQRRSDEPKQP